MGSALAGSSKSTGGTFTIPTSEPGVYHGELLLGGEDDLTEDNRRFFTYQVIERPGVLMIAADSEAGRFVRLALAPGDAGAGEQIVLGTKIVLPPVFDPPPNWNDPPDG